jgi:integrase
MKAPLTLAKIIELYVKNLEARVAADDYGDESLRLARIRLTAFSARYGHQTVAEAKQHNLSEWLAANPQWKSVDTKRGAISIVTACFSWALEEEIAERNPFHRPRVLRGKTGKIRRPATHEEYCQLMRHGSRPLRRVLFMLRRTGMRVGEVLGLCFDSVFLEGPTPFISLIRHKSFRKTGPRKIGLDASTARFLGNLARQYERRCNCACEACLADLSPNVFTNGRAGPWTRHTFARHLRRTAKAIGLDEGIVDRISGYSFRHLFAVNAIEAGISTRKISDQLGHQGSAMLDKIHGSHTRQRIEHLSSVADEINKKRKRKPHTKDHGHE